MRSCAWGKQRNWLLCEVEWFGVVVVRSDDRSLGGISIAHSLSQPRTLGTFCEHFAAHGFSFASGRLDSALIVSLPDDKAPLVKDSFESSRAVFFFCDLIMGVAWLESFDAYVSIEVRRGCAAQ